MQPPALSEEVRYSRAHVNRWLFVERLLYSDTKFPDKDQLNIQVSDSGFERDGWYMGFILNYLSRAQVLGASTLQGRQALAKALVTLTECLETSVRVHGNLPVPGVSSGNCERWDGVVASIVPSAFSGKEG